MADNLVLPAINGASDPAKVRVVLLSNGRLVHIALSELVKPLTDEIASLKTRIQTLEG